MHADLTVLWYQNDLWKAFFTFQGSISVGVDATDLFDNYNLIDSFNERWVLFLILDCSQSITSNTNRNIKQSKALSKDVFFGLESQGFAKHWS